MTGPELGKGTALIVVDMQNDFVRRGAPMEVAGARETLSRIAELARSFRQHQLQVVYTKFLAGPKPTLLWRWSPECAPPVRACWRGVYRHYDDLPGEREGPAIVDELCPHPGDEVIEKYNYDAFHHTALADVLRAHAITSLVVVGTVTQICVADTVHGAFHRGYETTVVEDATSSFDEELHRTALRNIGLKYGWVLTTGDVLNRISQPARNRQNHARQLKEEQKWTAS